MSDSQVAFEPQKPSSISQAVKEKGEFQTERVFTISAGHAVHDTYTGFLPALLPSLIDKFLLSKTEAGLLSVFFQMTALVQPFIGHLADRISLRYLLFLAPAVTGTAMSLLGLAPSYLALAVLLLIAGFSAAGIHTTGPIMAGRLSGDKLGRGMSFWMVGGEMGRTMGPLLVVSVIGYASLEGTAWLAVLGWATSAMLLIRLRQVSGKPPDGPSALPWRQAWIEMRSFLVPLSGILLARSLMNACLTTYLPVFMQDEGASLWVAGASLSILEASGVVGALLGGSLSDRFGRKKIMTISMLLTPVLVLPFLWTAVNTRLVFLPLLGFVSLSTTPVILAMVQETYPENRALSNGIFMALAFTARSLVVVIVGSLGDRFGLRIGFYLACALMFLATPLIARLPTRDSTGPSTVQSTPD